MFFSGSEFSVQSYFTCPLKSKNILKPKTLKTQIPKKPKTWKLFSSPGWSFMNMTALIIVRSECYLALPSYSASAQLAIICAERYLAMTHPFDRLSDCPPVRLSVRLTQPGIMSKRLPLQSCGLRCRIAHDSSFFVVNFTGKFQREHTQRGRRMREG